MSSRSPAKTPAGVFFQKHLPLFLDYLSAEKGLSSNTLEAYRRDLAAFGTYLASSRTDPTRVTRGDIVAYLGAGIEAFKFGRSWRVRFPIEAAV